MSTPTNPPEQLLFVYGTLQRGGRFHSGMTQAKAEFLTEASQTSKEFVMLNLSAYPALKETPIGEGTYITGELYSVPTEGLKIIDRIEGYPDYYSRKETTVWANGHSFKALVYYLKPETLKQMGTLPTVPTGTWFGDSCGAGMNASFAPAGDPYAAESYTDYTTYPTDLDCSQCGWWLTGDEECVNCASYEQAQMTDPSQSELEGIADEGVLEIEVGEYETADFTVDTGVFITDIDGNQYGEFEDIADACNNLGNVANMIGTRVEMLTVGFRVISNDVSTLGYSDIVNSTVYIKGN